MRLSRGDKHLENVDNKFIKHNSRFKIHEIKKKKQKTRNVALIKSKMR